MIMIRSRTLSTIILLVAGAGAGCRTDDRNPQARAQEQLLLNGSWKTFSEVYYPGRGYQIGFLQLGIVAHESGRMSDLWTITDPYRLEIVSGQNQKRIYRLFEPHNLLAYCRMGISKPFLIAPDSLEYERVLAVAKESGVYDCDAAAILSIAGAKLERLDDSLRTVISADFRGVDLDWQARSAIRHLSEAKSVSFSGVPLRDDDLAYVAHLDKIEELNLSDTSIGDEALVHLIGLNELRLLDVRRTKVTRDGVQRLLDELPDLKVHHSSTNAQQASLPDE